MSINYIEIIKHVAYNQYIIWRQFKAFSNVLTSLFKSRHNYINHNYYSEYIIVFIKYIINQMQNFKLFPKRKLSSLVPENIFSEEDLFLARNFGHVNLIITIHESNYWYCLVFGYWSIDCSYSNDWMIRRLLDEDSCCSIWQW